MRNAKLFSAAILIAVLTACGGGSPSAREQSGGGTGSGAGAWVQVHTPSAATQLNYVDFSSNNHWFIADRSHGFYRSTDQGASWTQINSGLATTRGASINVDPNNGDLVASIYSGTLNAYPVLFYRSGNEGNSWTLISSGHLSSAPAVTGCVFAANGNVVCGGYWAPYPNTGGWVSSNGGVTTTGFSIRSASIGSVFALGFDAVTRDLWMGTEQNGVFRSTDNGFTWTSASPADSNVDPVHGIRDGDVEGITYDRNGNVFFSSQGGIWKSSNNGGGYSWSNVFYSGSAGKALGRDANGNLYYGHAHNSSDPTSVYRSTDDGSTWTAFDGGLPLSKIGDRFVVNPADGKLYAVLADDVPNDGYLYATSQPVQ